MDRYVTLETLHGLGQVKKGGQIVLRDRRYHIEQSQRMIEVLSMNTPRSEVPGLKSIDGTLDGDIPFNLVGESIELELEDGRHWECFIQSTDGTLVNRGGLR